MSKVCKECGHQMDDNVQVCPNCGCPVKTNKAATTIDEAVLSQGKSTEAEAVVMEVANGIIKWGNYFSVFAAVLMVIGSVAVVKQADDIAGYIGIGIILGALAFFLIRMLAKITWSVIMLFVNISTTLKRIELKLEQNGTN